MQQCQVRVFHKFLQRTLLNVITISDIIRLILTLLQISVRPSQYYKIVSISNLTNTKLKTHQKFALFKLKLKIPNSLLDNNLLYKANFQKPHCVFD
jgi:hypothetical protein